MENNEDIPIMVGTLNRETGINGFKMAVPGHPVFELKDRYIIYLDSEKPVKVTGYGVETVYQDFVVAVPYYKKTLEPFINFIVNDVDQ